MENIERHQNEYPLFLKILLAFGALFLTSLGVLLASMIISMLGFAYGIANVANLVIFLEQAGIIMLGLSVMLGGGVSIMGLVFRSLSPTQAQHIDVEKAKNENNLYDIREHGLSVEDVLADMSMTERELLVEKLAESRLAIREDGVLIPLEQAEKLRRIERFSNG